MTRELASTISQENLRSIDPLVPQHLRPQYSCTVPVPVQLYSCTGSGTYVLVHTYRIGIRTSTTCTVHVQYMYSRTVHVWSMLFRQAPHGFFVWYAFGITCTWEKVGD